MRWAERVNRWERNRRADDRSHTSSVAFSRSAVVLGAIGAAAAAVVMTEGMGM